MMARQVGLADGNPPVLADSRSKNYAFGA